MNGFLKWEHANKIHAKISRKLTLLKRIKVSIIKKHTKRCKVSKGRERD